MSTSRSRTDEQKNADSISSSGNGSLVAFVQCICTLDALVSWWRRLMAYKECNSRSGKRKGEMTRMA